MMASPRAAAGNSVLSPPIPKKNRSIQPADEASMCQNVPARIPCALVTQSPEEEASMKRLVFASALVSLAIGVPILRAQGAGRSPQTTADPQRNWYSVTVTTVKPDHVREWIDIQKSQTIPMQQKGGIKSRDTWQNGAPFGEGNMFAIVTPIDKFATYDMPPLALRVLGEAPARAYQEKLAAVTISRRTFAIQDRVELSIPPAPTAKFVAAVLADVTIVSGHAQQYESYLKDDVVPLLKKDKDNVVGFLVSRTVFGGNVNEYHEVTLLSNFAAIDKGPAQARLMNATERASMAAKITPHVANIERTILRHVPDLSYQPRPAS
jgi:hypothetical protein